MIDWTARVDEVTQYLASEYGVEDREAIEILLAMLVPCPRTPPLWLVLETNWYARECQGAWFGLGGEWEPASLAKIRARRPWRESTAALTAWLEAPESTRLLIEPDPDRMALYRFMPEALFVLAKCLRLHTFKARSAVPLGMINGDHEMRRQAELAARVCAVTRDPTGARCPVPPSFAQPADMVYHTELVQRLSPWHRDWNEILCGFGALAVRRAWLYGRLVTDEEDRRTLARVARDTVPPWVRRALECLLASGTHAAPAQNLMRAMQMPEPAYHNQNPTAELRRLTRNGILRREGKFPVYRIMPDHERALAAILAGQAFEGQASSVPKQPLSANARLTV